MRWKSLNSKTTISKATMESQTAQHHQAHQDNGPQFNINKWCFAMIRSTKDGCILRLQDYRAYTLIEVIVSLGIISILMILIISAVQAARESARKIQCTSNMKQLGVALQSYHSAFNMFPPNSMYTGRNHSSNRSSALLHILPFIDQSVLFNSINMNLIVNGGYNELQIENLTAASSRLEIFLCPSDAANELCGTNYRFNHGKLGSRQARSDGPFSIGVNPSDATIRDGLANTIIMSERSSGTFESKSQNASRDIKYVDWSELNYPGDDIYIPYCVDSAASYWIFNAGRFWINNGMENTEYNHNGIPNDIRPSCGGTDFGLFPPRSKHNNLVNVLYGDGHVNVATNSINPSLWKALGTHNSGDLVSEQ